MGDSIFRSAIRAFLVALCSVMGFLIGLIAIMALFGSYDDNELSVERTFTAAIVPNANNVRKAESKDAPVILSINIKGEIGTEKLNQKEFNTLLIESREGIFKDNRVKALFLVINSPGGTFSDADGIYNDIKAYKEQYKVPVIAFVDGLCASGGMYIACAADEIYATDVSLIGSVGVLTPSFFNVTKFLEKVGVDSLTLSAGRDKDELNPFRPWKEGEEKHLQSIIDYYYDYFVNIVTSNRPKMDREKLVKEYGANIFAAKSSLEKGYIDGIVKDRGEALRKLLAKISIEDDYYQVVQLESSEWWRSLFTSKSPLFTGQVTHQINLEPFVKPQLMNKYLLLYQPN